MTIPQTLDLALFHHQAGRLAEAESLYLQILAVQPNHVEAMHHLGIIAHQAGRHDLAIKLIQQAVLHDPDHAAAHSNLGEAWRMMGRLDEAVAAYRRALAINPDHVEALNNLGNVLKDRGAFEEAVDLCRRALDLRPDYAEAHNNLGNALTDLGRFDEAITALGRALQLKPDYLEAHYNLGIALRGRGQLEDAIIAYRRALEIKPDFAKAHMNLGNALTEIGRLDEAIAALGRAVELQPDYADAYYNLGVAFQLSRRLDDALNAYQRAFALKPDFAEAHNNMGRVLTELGRMDEAVTEYRRALALQPERAATHSNIIFTLHLLPGQDRAKLAAEEQRLWNRKFGDPAKRLILPYPNDRQPERRLRIGYVSTDFRDHVAGRNLRPLFRNHDHRNFEILCYSGVTKQDGLTDEFRRQADQWRSTVESSDEALADVIRRDGVDILVDLSQHTADNQLPVFARKPAPVQVSFAAYPGSTGVEAIEYRISDRWLESGSGIDGGRTSQDIPQEMQVAGCRLQNDSEGNFHPVSCILHPASAFSPFEQVFLIDSFWCYDPCGVEVAVNGLPARLSGCVTFGSLNNFSKLNEPLLKNWAQVLAGVKDSHLVILTGLGAHRQRTLDFLQQEGVESHRVEFVAPLPRRDYLKLYHRLDLMLDTFPYNGHTTSLDALWMGVPVVSLVGEQPVSRAGLSQLSNLGLPELAAFSEDDYVRIATQLAHDLPRVAELRATLRSRMKNSVLMDAPRFARQIEAAYRAMWRQWCIQQGDA